MKRGIALALQLALSALQVAAGIASLAWAAAWLGNPPFLGHGLFLEHGKLSRLLQGNEAAGQPLQDLHQKLGWLFDHHSEGVLVALVGGLVLILGALAQAGLSLVVYARPLTGDSRG